MEPPEAQSVKSMMHIARILAIIFGVILILIGLADAALVAYYASICATFVGYDAYCGPIGFLLVGPIIALIFGVFDFIIYMKLKSIEVLVNNRQYEQAKAQTLIWMILGFVLGGVIIGIILLVAYLKFDPLINWQRSGGQPGMAPPAYAPPAAPMAAPPSPPPPAAQPAAAPFCPKCGQPTTYVAQYGRYYCYTDKQYV
jgi:hypothetical protein